MEISVQKCLAFVETVRYGSFTKAAEVLSYSQSGISRMVSELERECGVVLLERDARGVRLSSDGLELLESMQSLCHEYNELCAHVDRVRGVQSGVIRIGATESLAVQWVPNIIETFHQDYPGIRFEIIYGDYSELETKVREGTIDLAFLRLLGSNKFYEIKLESEAWVAVLPPDNPLATHEAVSPAELMEYPFILPENIDGKVENDVVSRALARWGLKPKTLIATWFDNSTFALVEKGLGVSILPELCTRRIPYHVVTKPLLGAKNRDIGVILKDIKSASIATKRFLDYLGCRDQKCR